MLYCGELIFHWSLFPKKLTILAKSPLFCTCVHMATTTRSPVYKRDNTASTSTTTTTIFGAAAKGKWSWCDCCWQMPASWIQFRARTRVVPPHSRNVPTTNGSNRHWPACECASQIGRAWTGRQIAIGSIPTRQSAMVHRGRAGRPHRQSK